MMGANVQIHLGRRDLAVAQQGLDGPRIGPILQKMGCKTMSPGVL